eukprot:10956276-Ditylum_brightwellii.AAC.1
MKGRGSFKHWEYRRQGKYQQNSLPLCNQGSAHKSLGESEREDEEETETESEEDEVSPAEK